MEDINHQDIDMNHNDDNNISDSDSDVGYEYVYTPVDDSMTYTRLDNNTLQRLKQNDPNPTINKLSIRLNHDNGSFFNSIDWKVDGVCIADNTQLEKLFISHGHIDGRNYILGEQGHNLPTRQQLQDFFSCVYRSSSINYIKFHSIQIIDEFGGGLIEGLCGHPSIETLDIGHGSIESVACIAIGKLLKHPASKLKDVSLNSCQLDDNGLSIVCDSLLGNSRMMRLNLDGNKKITSIGWGALSTVLQHPKCKLVNLQLYGAEINDESANILGIGLRGSSVKALDLSYNQSISRTGWHTLFNQLSQTSIVHLKLIINNIDDAGLAALATIGTLKSLDLSYNQSITPLGWYTFFILLQRIGIQLKKLSISGNNVDDVGVAALGSLMSHMTSLEALNIDTMIDGPNSITPHGWVSFFTTLQDSNNTRLAELCLHSNQIDDEGIRQLVPLVSNMTSLKHLTLNNNRSVTPTGWLALSDYLQSPNFALKELCLFDNNINDDTVAAFTSALVHNKILEWLTLDDCLDEDENELISERGWDAISALICNKTSMIDTYNSNHTLHSVCYYIPVELDSLLDLNKNKDKTEVARQKILQTHFRTEDNDTTNMQVLLDLELEVMPVAISWMGRPTHDDSWRGAKVSGMSLLYNLMRRLPDLFDSNAQKKTNAEASKD